MIPPPFPFPDQWPAVFQQQRRDGARTWLTPHTGTSLSTRAIYAPSATSSGTLAPVQPATIPSPSWWSDQNGVQGVLNDALLGEADEASDEEDYEYGYVLSDQWRRYLQENILSAVDENKVGADCAESSVRSHRSRDANPRAQPKRPRGGKKQQRVMTPRAPSQLDVVLVEARELEKQREQARLVSWPTGQDDDTMIKDSAPRRGTLDGSKHAGLPDSDGKQASLRVVHQLEAEFHVRFEDFCDAQTPVVWPQGAS
jgi:hypothetical protein